MRVYIRLKPNKAQITIKAIDVPEKKFVANTAQSN